MVRRNVYAPDAAENGKRLSLGNLAFRAAKSTEVEAVWCRYAATSVYSRKDNTEALNPRQLKSRGI